MKSVADLKKRRKEHKAAKAALNGHFQIHKIAIRKLAVFYDKLLHQYFNPSKQDLIKQAAEQRSKHKMIVYIRSNGRKLITESVILYHQVLKPIAEVVAMLLGLTAYIMLMGGSIALLLKVAYEELTGLRALRMQNAKPCTTDPDRAAQNLMLIAIMLVGTLITTLLLQFIKAVILKTGDYLLWYPNYKPLDKRVYTDDYNKLCAALQMDDVAKVISITQPHFANSTSIPMFKKFREETITLHALASELGACNTTKLLEKINDGDADQYITQYLQDESRQSDLEQDPLLEELYPAWGLRSTLQPTERAFLEDIRSRIPSISIPADQPISIPPSQRKLQFA